MKSKLKIRSALLILCATDVVKESPNYYVRSFNDL